MHPFFLSIFFYPNIGLPPPPPPGPGPHRERGERRGLHHAATLRKRLHLLTEPTSHTHTYLHPSIHPSIPFPSSTYTPPNKTKLGRLRLLQARARVAQRRPAPGAGQVAHRRLAPAAGHHRLGDPHQAAGGPRPVPPHHGPQAVRTLRALLRRLQHARRRPGRHGGPAPAHHGRHPPRRLEPDAQDALRGGELPGSQPVVRPPLCPTLGPRSRAGLGEAPGDFGPRWRGRGGGQPGGGGGGVRGEGGREHGGMHV